MSEGQDFDTSLLDGKDRNELMAIATSLGQKPTARAKKADLISMIVEAVGAGPESAPEEKFSGGGGDATAEVAPVEEPEVDTAATGEPTATEPSAEATADEPDTGRTDALASDDRRGGTHEQQPAGGGGRSPDRTDQGSTGERAGGGGRTQRPQSGDHVEPANRAEPAQPQLDDGEANRRRRRRGRDRNRQMDDEMLNAEPVDVEGFVDLRDEGYAFLRVDGYLPSPTDAYVSIKQVRQFGLRKGDVVTGRSRAANRNEKNPALIQVDSVNGVAVSESMPVRPDFEKLTPLYPDEPLRLEQTEFPENMTARIADLLAPIGKGQRGLVVSPPKAGKTTVMKDIVRAVERNHPEVHVIVLLVDERPEEVTDLRRWMLAGEVAASTFDRPAEEHIALAELVIERAKRLVEAGRDVFVFLDGITRLTRAYNLVAPGNGRTMAGGMDTSALYPPKRFFGAARNVEEGGSLTILATALVETNTRLDEVVFEEFKGTGNMELRLDRRLAERRVFPAIDVDGSSTRHEELLYPRSQLQQVYRLRRLLSDMKADSGSGASGLEMLVERLRTIRTNEAFLAEVARATS